MGYTHYFNQNKPATNDQWDAICNDFNKLRTVAMLTKAFPIQRECDDTAAPEVSTQFIIFNGIGDAGHETMFVDKEGNGFQFCKTNNKPYDIAVVALLLLMYHHAPDVWVITSDGDTADWLPAIKFVNGSGIGEFFLPPSID